MNPLTPLTLAACAVAATLIVDQVWVSAVAVAVSACVALVFPARAARPFFLSLGIGVPAFIGLGLVYAPFGSQPGWWIFTADGTATAARLALKLLASASIGLTVGSFVHFDALMRAIQTRLPAPLVYVVGATFRLYPMARARLRTIQQIRATRGLDQGAASLVGRVRSSWQVALPLIVGLVDDAGQRTRPLQRSGFGQPGPRTVLRPVADTLAQRLVRLSAVVALIVVAVGAAVGWF